MLWLDFHVPRGLLVLLRLALHLFTVGRGHHGLVQVGVGHVVVVVLLVLKLKNI